MISCKRKSYHVTYLFQTFEQFSNAHPGLTPTVASPEGPVWVPPHPAVTPSRLSLLFPRWSSSPSEIIIIPWLAYCLTPPRCQPQESRDLPRFAWPPGQSLAHCCSSMMIRPMNELWECRFSGVELVFPTSGNERLIQNEREKPVVVEGTGSTW